eukprot:sb/3476271/
MSSVGYGDMYPKTILGKFIGSAVIFGSTVFMAVPMTIIVTKFGECYGKMKNAKQVRARTDRHKLTTNQNSLFRSRDWLSANQRPVFRSVPSQEKYSPLYYSSDPYLVTSSGERVLGTK